MQQMSPITSWGRIGVVSIINIWRNWQERGNCIAISAQVESELVALEDEDKHEYLKDLGVEDPSSIASNRCKVCIGC